MILSDIKAMGSNRDFVFNLTFMMEFKIYRNRKKEITAPSVPSPSFHNWPLKCFKRESDRTGFGFQSRPPRGSCGEGAGGSKVDMKRAPGRSGQE